MSCRNVRLQPPDPLPLFSHTMLSNMAQGLTGARCVVLLIIFATMGCPSDGALQCIGSACTSIDLCNESRRAASAYTLRCPGGGFWRCTDGGGGTDLQCPYSPLSSFSLMVHCEGLAIGPPSTVDWYCGASRQSTTCYNWRYACLDARPAANAALTCTGVACKGKDLCGASRQAVAPYKLTCPGGGSWKCMDVATQQAKECAAPNQMQLTVHCEGLAIGPPSTVDYTCGSQGPISTVCYNWRYYCLDQPARVSGSASTAPDNTAAYQQCVNGCKGQYVNYIGCCCPKDSCYSCLSAKNAGDVITGCGKIIVEIIGWAMDLFG